jgi:DNA-directed RNA polymerase subunit N (RpoN/RPB10)
MIIPIKCFSCGCVLADKYRWYLTKVAELKADQNINEQCIYLTKTNTTKTPEGKVLDELGLVKQCCRRHMLTHVDIEY